MAEPGVRLVKISDLARMSGVPTPTIKHYIREGLLPGPARRTSRNMAYYDARLAARVRAIKDLQKSRYLPLKIIGALLEPPPSSAIRADLDESERRQLGASADAGIESLYTGADLELLAILDEARASGLGELFTLDVLASYAEAVRALVREEMAMSRRHMAGGAHLPSASRDALARHAAALGERLVVALRRRFLARELDGLAGEPSESQESQASALVMRMK
jgi:DNA-binding transcriptional MerR regulator